MTKFPGVIHVVASEHFVADSQIDQQRYRTHAGQTADNSHQYFINSVFVHPFDDARNDVREDTSADKGQAQVETYIFPWDLSLTVGLGQGYCCWEDHLETHNSWCNDGFDSQIDQGEDDGGAVALGEEACVEPSEEGSEANDAIVLPGVERILIVVADGSVVFHSVVDVFFHCDQREGVDDGQDDHPNHVVFGAIGKFDQFSLGQEG